VRYPVLLFWKLPCVVRNQTNAVVCSWQHTAVLPVMISSLTKLKNKMIIVIIRVHKATLTIAIHSRLSTSAVTPADEYSGKIDFKSLKWTWWTFDIKFLIFAIIWLFISRSETENSESLLQMAYFCLQKNQKVKPTWPQIDRPTALLQNCNMHRL